MKYTSIVHKTVDTVPEILGLSEYLTSSSLEPGNAYLQILIRLACILNDITTVNDSTKITATDLRFDYRIRKCAADPSEQWHEVLQLTSMYSLTGRGAEFLRAPGTLQQRATAEARLRALTGVHGDPTCCCIPLIIASQKSKDTKDRTSYVKFFWVPVLPGVARKTVQEMKDSGKSEKDYVSDLVEYVLIKQLRAATALLMGSVMQ